MGHSPPAVSLREGQSITAQDTLPPPRANKKGPAFADPSAISQASARQAHAAGCTPASESHSRIFCLGMAPTFMDDIWPSLNSIMVGMPRTP